jgi:oligoendopeptidase F
MSELPRWDLSNVYPGLDSAEYDAAVASIGEQIGELDRMLTEAVGAPLHHAGSLAAVLGEAIARINQLIIDVRTHGAYINSFVSTDSRNMAARTRLSEFERVRVEFSAASTRFTQWVGSLGDALDEAIVANDLTEQHAFILRETADQAKYLMSEAEERLASELSLSGGNAFAKLQGTVTSQLTAPFALDGETKSLPMTALINLKTHPDESVRRRAWETENEAWKSVEEPLAFAMNGVKGETITLNNHRGRTNPLHAPLDFARMDRATLDAMLEAMHDSFPTFRRYWHAKAKLIGKERLAWWDIAAPVGSLDKVYTWDETRSFILENFGTFSPGLAAWAQRAFDENWMDVPPREGKRAGAFCMGVPGVKESRILLNFDGSLDQISTVAHELGHGWHNECIYQAGTTALNAQTPMTLAETASIMCETIVMQAVLKKAENVQQELGILETQLQGEAQVIVDIYSRYLFESELFERRAKSEVSAADLNEMMLNAQRATYGDGLDERFLQQYMWTWKPHYYSPAMPFYNFPYAFGLLFATGLYAIYKERGSAFVPDYNRLLASTGEARAADLAARFGIDIRSKAFWAASLATIGKKVDRYVEIANS